MSLGSRALNIGRAIGAVGSSVPGGDAGVIAFIRAKSGTPIGLGARQGMKYVGGPAAAISWGYLGYQNRAHISNAAARSLQGLSMGLYEAPASAWQSSPKTWTTPVGTKSESRVVRSKPSPTGRRRSSAQTRSPIRLGKSRNRCRTRYRGKRCRLPAGHSGRHSYS